MGISNQKLKWGTDRRNRCAGYCVGLFLVLFGVVASARQDLQSPFPTLAPVLEEVMPAVVNISTTQIQLGSSLIEEFFGLAPQRSDAPNSLGSGVIIDAEDGLVITNFHVVENSAEILVTLSDGREVQAELVGTDPRADIALLRINVDRLEEIEWGDSDDLRVGDFCVAIGNPFGLGQTVTSGIVSALGRSGLGIEELEDFIQTDASINPGNSGGALINLAGELIGINTAIVGPSGGNVGIGFAIPANMARDIAHQLVEYGEVRRGVLGIGAQSLTPELARSFGIQQQYGVVIVKVDKDSAAARSGLQVGDIILELNGKRVKSVAGVVNRLGLLRVGERVRLRILRGRQEMEISSTVTYVEPIHRLLKGATFDDAITRQRRPYVVIDSVQAGSSLDRIGLRPGDIILSVDKEPVASVDDLKKLIDPKAKRLLLLVQRGRETEYVLID